MMGFVREIRIVPVVIVAALCLLGLKFSGLVFDGGYTLGDRLAGRNKNELTIVSADSVPKTPVIVVTGSAPDTSKQRSWAQDVFGYPDVTGSVSASKTARKSADPITTGSAGAGKPADGAAKKPDGPAKEGEVLKVATDPPRLSPVAEPQRGSSPGERAVLERLQDRRQEIESRARELEMRENLLKQAEGRLDSKLIEVKSIEGKIAGAAENRDKAEVQRFKSLVSMYENMKPKDAARIFDKLDLKVLVELVNQINPRKMSDILAQMSSEAAQRLTVDLAQRADTERGSGAGGLPSLPKIEGQAPAAKPPQVSQKGP